MLLMCEIMSARGHSSFRVGASCGNTLLARGTKKGQGMHPVQENRRGLVFPESTAAPGNLPIHMRKRHAKLELT